MVAPVSMSRQTRGAGALAEGARAELAQERVVEYFHDQSAFWDELYARGTVYAQIHQRRLRAVLGWIDGLELPVGNAADVGCGAGYLALALAGRGWQVTALDAVEAMVVQARQHVAEAGVSERVSVALGDATKLEAPAESFDLVVALGVLPWLDRPREALCEMARVVRPGGYVIVTADNRARLNAWLDPWLNPLLLPVKQQVKQWLGRRGRVREIGSHWQWRREVDADVARAGLMLVRRQTLGFGPFTLLRRELLPVRWGLAANERLQALADRRAPILRGTGAQYLVLAQKPMRADG